MAKEEKKAPKLRFNGYTNDWERKKLGDVANSYINGGTPDTQNKNYWIGDIPWIQSSDLKNDDIWNVNINKYITNKAVNDSAAKLIPTNSIAIVTRVGVGKLAYMSQEYSTSQDFLSLVDIKEDLIFIMYMLYFKISKVSSSLQGTSIKGITKKELLNLSISIVNNTAEQNRIGQVFKILDNSINLHERKYEELTLIKKALLQKLFPKKDGFKPEVRYKNFNDAWEQRKLGEVVERRIEKRRQSERYPRLAFASGQGVIPLSERKTNNREQLTKDEFTKKYLVTELDDIVYNPANVKYGAIDRNKYGRGLISPIYVTFTTEEVPGFIERIVKSHDFKQKALRFEEGTVTKRQSVNPEDLVTINILVASQKKEQKKISLFFDNIDTFIALHRRKLEKLKQLKKFLLQNMFI
ncbi:restriction endonuclease subunit S [Ligilactobacillus salivarius]|uniref:restriction endonuclease subunit S n=2 Tax=Ligilactobacillus salivarius TaxID=1624 RepID=UPI001CDA9380|nr:restriction endonuclease subunit S [Ligilactobacillus salivarius]